MLLWTLTFLLSAGALRQIAPVLLPEAWESPLSVRRSMRGLEQVVALLHELEETLQAGLLPERSRWSALAALPRPWGTLAAESIAGIRDQGGALLPTLTRLRALAESQREALRNARAKAAQAIAQSVICVGLVPLAGSLLYLALPGVSEHPWTWLLLCGLAFGIAAAGAGWLWRMSDSARWGGLPPPQRPWWLAALCGGERFLALLRSGQTPDIAWQRTCELLDQEAPGLADLWGRAVWREPAPEPARQAVGAAAALAEAGSSIRKAIQVSLMEGRPCSERVEATLATLRSELRAQVERELTLLGTRALKPLFLCVAPSLLGMLGFALYLAWSAGLGDFHA